MLIDCCDYYCWCKYSKNVDRCPLLLIFWCSLQQSRNVDRLHWFCDRVDKDNCITCSLEILVDAQVRHIADSCIVNVNCKHASKIPVVFGFILQKI